MKERRAARLGAQVLGIWALAFSAAVSSAAAQQTWVGSNTPLPVDPLVRTGTLENGLTYYVRANARPEGRAELRLVVDAGSILEGEDQQGLAHFLEHMAFNGTESFERQELVRYLEGIGMRFGPDLNAYTSFDETVYMLTVPTDSLEALETGIEILSEWAGGIRLETEEIEAERGVVIEEWRGRLGAQDRVSRAQFPVLLQGSRYPERFPIGDPETLAGFSPETLRRFYSDWYRPELMAVVAVGDFDADRVEGWIRGLFAELPAREGPARPPVHEVPGHPDTRIHLTTDPELTTTRIEVLRKRPATVERTVDDFRAMLVQTLYDAMLSDRLAEIAERPDAPFLGAGSSHGVLVRGTAAYALSAVVPEGGVEAGLEALLLEAQRVRRHGFTETELERAKLNLLRSYERAYAERERTNSAAYAAQYVSHFLHETPVPGIEFEYPVAQAALAAVTLEEVNALAAEATAESDRVVLVSAPEKAGVALPAEAELARVVAAAEAADVAAYVDDVPTGPLVPELPVPGAVVSEERHDAVDVTEWRLANGVTVLVKPTDFRDDEVLLSAFSPGGLSLAPDDLVWSAQFAPQIVQLGGLGDFARSDLERALAGKAASLTPFIGDLEEGMSGTASPADLETLFQLAHLHFTAPRFDEGAAEALRAQLRAVLANRGADPNAVFGDTVQVTLVQHHPRFPPPTPAMVDELDTRAAFGFFEERFGDASDFTFVIVGNVDPAGLRPLVERWLGSLPATGRAETWRDHGVRPPEGVVEKVVRAGVEPRAQTRLVFSGPMAYTRENRYQLRALADVLDMRLRERLREALGGTYGVSVAGSSVSRPEERYTFNIAFGSAPERLDELTAAVFEEIERLQTEGPTADEIRRVREIQRRERETSLRQNGYWVQQLAGYQREGIDFAEILTYEELIADLTPQVVRDAASAWLGRDAYVRVSLLPEG